jgi:hypothetical protein
MESSTDEPCTFKPFDECELPAEFPVVVEMMQVGDYSYS